MLTFFNHYTLRHNHTMSETTPKLRIKEWAEEDRPREKMLLKGSSSLSDAELLAILIGSGNNDETAVELAQRILKYANHSLVQLSRLSINELVNNFKGVGPAKAITIVSAMELARRRPTEKQTQRDPINSSIKAYHLFYPALCDLPHEELWIALLNQSCKLIIKIKISQGGINETAADIRIILKQAIDSLASCLLVCHNHPSGNHTPSEQDNRFTRKLKEAASLLDLTLMDHIILCDGSYYSYADEGNL